MPILNKRVAPFDSLTGLGYYNDEGADLAVAEVEAEMDAEFLAIIKAKAPGWNRKMHKNKQAKRLRTGRRRK